MPSENLKQMLVGEIVSSYQSLYQLAGCDRPYLIPDLYLDLALSLSHLPDLSWARKQIEYSIQVWLMLRNGVSSIKEQKPGLLELLEALALTVGDEDYDEDYAEKLDRCLTAIEIWEEVERKLAERKRQQQEAERQRQRERKETMQRHHQEQRKFLVKSKSNLGGKLFGLNCPSCGELNYVLGTENCFPCFHCFCNINLQARRNELRNI